jgi:hypothetical protein
VPSLSTGLSLTVVRLRFEAELGLYEGTLITHLANGAVRSPKDRTDTVSRTESETGMGSVGGESTGAGAGSGGGAVGDTSNRAATGRSDATKSPTAKGPSCWNLGVLLFWKTVGPR